MTSKKNWKAKSNNKIPKHQRTKIEKKKRDGKRKDRRELNSLKKGGSEPGKKRMTKELKVPQLHLVKKKMLMQLKRKRDGMKAAKHIENKDEEAERLRMLQIANEKRLQVGEGMEEEEVAQTDELKSEGQMRIKNNVKALKYIYENADVVLEVLDARDPMGTRCFAAEKNFLANNPEKRLILVINKIDLVPLDVTNQWKDILSKEFPTVLFKSNLQEQNSNLSANRLYSKSMDSRKEMVEEMLSSSKSLGAEKLLELIKNYSRTGTGAVSAISVGVIGFPNVGKSSLINSMTKRKAVGVSSVAGYTKSIQEVEVDSKVTIFDCPGIVPSQDDELTLVLRNTIKPEDVNDVERAVKEILNRGKKEQILKLYKIEDYTDHKDFLIQFATKAGKIKRGGILDLEETGRTVIRDWNVGRITYYVPPLMQVRNVQNVIQLN